MLRSVITLINSMAGWAKHGLKLKDFHLPEHYHSMQ